MKVKRASFFYNTRLLDNICSGENNQVRTAHEFTDTIVSGDIIKFIGETISAIVKVINIEEKDCNGNCLLTVEVVKSVPGELEIEY